MPTIFSHAVTALAFGKLFTDRRMVLRFWLASVFCACIPDIDVLGFRFGIHYGDLLGHRGLTHSLLFALVLALVVVLALFRRPLAAASVSPQGERRAQLLLVGYFFMVTASHGVLDAMTNGGLGIAFFAPFDTTRYFLPWRPIEVSPIGAAHFFTERGMVVILSELKWVWLPSVALAAVAALLRRLRSRGSIPAQPIGDGDGGGIAQHDEV